MHTLLSPNKVVPRKGNGARSYHTMPIATDQILRCTVHSEPHLKPCGNSFPIFSDTPDANTYHRSSARLSAPGPLGMTQTVNYFPDIQMQLTDNKLGNTSGNERKVQLSIRQTREDAPHCHDLKEVVWSDVPAPNGGWGWLIVVGSFLCLLSVDGVVYSYGLLMHQAISEGRFFSCSHGLDTLTVPSLAALSFPGGLFSGITWLIGPLVGALTNRFGYRSVAALGALMVTIAFLLTGLVVRTIGVFTVTFGLLGGVGCGLIYLPAVTVVGYWFECHRALVVGLTMCGSGVGAVLLAVAFRLLSTHSSWHAIFVLAACLFCQNLVGIALFRPLHIHEIILIKRAARCAQISKSKKKPFKAGKTSWWTRLLRRLIKPSIPRGSIMARIIEEKSRQRTTSTGSLDGMVITRNNELVALPAEACEIAIAAASIYAGNQLLSEPEQSLKATAASKCVTAPAAQNLESLQEGVTFSPVSSAVYEVSAPKECGSRPLVPSALRASSQLASVVSLHSRTDRFIARELSVLPLDRNTSAVIMTALRAELSRPKYRMDLCYPDSRWWKSSPINRRQIFPPSVSYSRLSTTSPKESLTQPDEHISFVADPPQLHKQAGALELTGDCETQLPGFHSRTSFPNCTTPINLGIPELFSTTEDSPSNEFTTYLRDMLNTQLLRKPTFLLMLLACSLNVSVMPVPFHYLPLLLDLGGAECRANPQRCPTGLPYSPAHSGESAAGLFSWIADESAFAGHVATLVVLGVAGIAGRLVTAVYIERGLNTGLRSRGRCRKLTDPMLWNNSALVLCGLSLAGLPLAINGLLVNSVTPSTPGETRLVQYWSMETRMALFFFSALGYGFANAISLSLRSVILVELFGIRHLTNAFGYLIITQGISAVIGPTLFGYLCDPPCRGLLGHYNPRDYERLSGSSCTHRLVVAFYACAAVFLLSACLFAPLRWLNTLVVCSDEQRRSPGDRRRPSADDVSKRCPSQQCAGLNITVGTSYDPQETKTTHILPDSGMLNNGLLDSIRSPVTLF